MAVSGAAATGAQPCTSTRVLSHILMLNKLFPEQEQEFSLFILSHSFSSRTPLLACGKTSFPGLKRGLSLYSFNLGLPHPAPTTDRSPEKGQEPLPASICAFIPSLAPSHMCIVQPVFPCLMPAFCSSVSLLRVDGTLLAAPGWGTGRVCSHTAPFIREVVTALCKAAL